MVEFAIILLLEQAGRNDWKGSHVEPVKYPSEVKTMTLPYHCFESQSTTLRIRGQRDSKDFDVREGANQERKIKCDYFRRLSPTKKIDIASFVLLTTFYLIFSFIHIKL